MQGGLICLVVGEYREFSGLLECSRRIFSSLFFGFLFFFFKKKKKKNFVLIFFKKKAENCAYEVTTKNCACLA